jgi:hypothetical protein
MNTKFTMSLLITLTMLMLSACAGITTGDDLQSAATQTLGAQLAQTGVAAAAATNTAEFERLNAVIATQDAQLTEAAATATALPIAASETASSEETAAPELAVTLEFVAQTACRTGTSSVFEIVVAFEAGETAMPVNRNEDGTWYEILLDNGVSCWVFDGENMTVSGLPGTLPIVDAPSVPTVTLGPTQEPGFFMGSRLIYSCGAKEYISFAVQSQGGVQFQSGRISLYNKTTATDLGSDDGNFFFFTTADSCENQGKDTLSPGETRYIHMELKSTTVDDEIQVNARLCTEKALAGTCFNRALLTHK